MWNFASKVIVRAKGLKNDLLKSSPVPLECSDDETSSMNNSRDEGLECPICWDSFNIVENVPYVLWCGHTLCKNCVLGLQRAVMRFPTLPIQLPFFVNCPWCNQISLRLVYKGNLKFPSKNFFLLWMVESMNGDRSKSQISGHGDCRPVCSSNRNQDIVNQLGHANNRQAPCTHHRGHSESNHGMTHLVSSYFNAERVHLSLRKSLVLFVHLTAKFPLVLIFLLIVLYAIPASAAILALYILITVVFALPSFLVLYLAIPSLDWLLREIVN